MVVSSTTNKCAGKPELAVRWLPLELAVACTVVATDAVDGATRVVAMDPGEDGAVA